VPPTLKQTGDGLVKFIILTLTVAALILIVPTAFAQGVFW